jgi:hypothetical protein
MIPKQTGNEIVAKCSINYWCAFTGQQIQDAGKTRRAHRYRDHAPVLLRIDLSVDQRVALQRQLPPRINRSIRDLIR